MFVFLLINIVITGTQAFSCSKDSKYSLEWDKEVIYPYHISNIDKCICQEKCESDTRCNGYSTNCISYNCTCFLSSCNYHNNKVECSSCRFHSKKNTTSSLSCAPAPEMPFTPLLLTTANGDQKSMEQNTPERQHTVTHSTTKEQTTAEKQSMSTKQTNSGQHHTLTATRKQSLARELTTTLTWTTSWMSSSNTKPMEGTAQITINSTLCSCVCKYTNKTLRESVHLRRRELILNKSELSSNKRKLTSAQNTRRTAGLVGTVAAIILVGYALLFVCADVWTVLEKKVFQNCFTRAP